MSDAFSVYSSALAESRRARPLATKLSVAARIDARSASLKSGGTTLQAAMSAIRQGMMGRISAPLPDHGLDGAGQLGADPLRLRELHLVFGPPLGRHVRAEIRRRQQLAVGLEPG